MHLLLRSVRPPSRPLPRLIQSRSTPSLPPSLLSAARDDTRRVSQGSELSLSANDWPRRMSHLDATSSVGGLSPRDSVGASEAPEVIAAVLPALLEEVLKAPIVPNDPEARQEVTAAFTAAAATVLHAKASAGRPPSRGSSYNGSSADVLPHSRSRLGSRMSLTDEPYPASEISGAYPVPEVAMPGDPLWTDRPLAGPGVQALSTKTRSFRQTRGSFLVVDQRRRSSETNGDIPQLGLDVLGGSRASSQAGGRRVSSAESEAAAAIATLLPTLIEEIAQSPRMMLSASKADVAEAVKKSAAVALARSPFSSQSGGAEPHSALEVPHASAEQGEAFQPVHELPSRPTEGPAQPEVAMPDGWAPEGSSLGGAPSLREQFLSKKTRSFRQTRGSFMLGGPPDRRRRSSDTNMELPELPSRPVEPHNALEVPHVPAEQGAAFTPHPDELPTVPESGPTAEPEVTMPDSAAWDGRSALPATSGGAPSLREQFLSKKTRSFRQTRGSFMLGGPPGTIDSGAAAPEPATSAPGVSENGSSASEATAVIAAMLPSIVDEIARSPAVSRSASRQEIATLVTKSAANALLQRSASGNLSGTHTPARVDSGVFQVQTDKDSSPLLAPEQDPGSPAPLSLESLPSRRSGPGLHLPTGPEVAARDLRHGLGSIITSKAVTETIDEVLDEMAAKVEVPLVPAAPSTQSSGDPSALDSLPSAGRADGGSILEITQADQQGKEPELVRRLAALSDARAPSLPPESSQTPRLSLPTAGVVRLFPVHLLRRPRPPRSLHRRLSGSWTSSPPQRRRWRPSSARLSPWRHRLPRPPLLGSSRSARP